MIYRNVLGSGIRVGTTPVTFKTKVNTVGLKYLSTSAYFNSKYSSLHFNCGHIQHEKFGKLEEWKGILPFTLPPSLYQLPAIVGDTPSLNNIVESLAPKVKTVFPGLTEDELSEFIKDCTIATACLSPDHDIHEPGMRILSIYWLLGFAMDDIVDSRGEANRNLFISYKKFVKLWGWAVRSQKFISFIVENFTDTPAAKLNSLTALTSYFLDELEAYNPELRKKLFSGPCVEAIFRSAGTKIFQLETNSREVSLSFSAMRTIFRHINGMEAYAEYVSLCFGPKLTDTVRRDVLFHMMMESFSNICVNVNAIFGLGRDVEECNTMESPILFRVMDGQMTLNDSYQESLKIINGSYKDFKIFSDQICDVYPSDSSVNEYVRMLKYILDGSLYAYTHMNRYGIKLKTVYIDKLTEPDS